MRLGKLDMLRGIAIILMIFFHLNYVLIWFFGIEFLSFSEFFWFVCGKIGALLFICISGISFFLAYKKYKEKVIKKYLKYSLFLGIISFCITILTYFFVKEQLILFGILHFFCLSFLLILLFRKFYYFNLFLSILIIFIPIFFSMEVEKQGLFFLGFYTRYFASADYYPLIPYFGYFLLSYFIACFADRRGVLENILILKNDNNVSKFLSFLGKYSLIIYLSHVPIIMVLIYSILKIKTLWNT